MKRLVATLSVVAALVISAVATAPASAKPISFHGVEVTCENITMPKGAKYTVTFDMHTFSFTIPDTTCIF
jgi:hypothetical protein